MSKEFLHETDAHRYTMHLDGQLVASLDYSARGDSRAFTRTFTVPPFRGRGFAAELTEFAVNDVEANTAAHILPVCWYVEDWFALHPERADMLSPRGATASAANEGAPTTTDADAAEEAGA